MKSIIQEVHEGLSEEERAEMERLAEHRGVCPCSLLKGWLMAAFKRVQEKRLSGDLVDEVAFCPRCASEACDNCPMLSCEESVTCVTKADESEPQVGNTITL